MGLFFYILLQVTVFGHASENIVNQEMQKTQNKIDSRPQIYAPKKIQRTAPRPSIQKSEPVDDIEPLQPNEEFHVGERPRGGYVKSADPAAEINEELKEKQDYEKYKKNYRKALIKEIESSTDH